MKPAELVKPYAAGRMESTGKERILILCEGEATEPQYFAQFVRHFELPANQICVRTIKGQQTPLGIVKAAAGELLFASYLSRTNSDRIPFTEVWCVFDRDQHADFDDALAFAMSSELNLYVAPSNPCFEIWLLHHFVARRKAYVGKGAPVGKPSTVLEKLEDGTLRETVTTIYLPANPAALCQNELKTHWPDYSKKLSASIDNFGPKFLKAVGTDLPVAAKQPDSAGCWTLVPRLLVRLLQLKYETEEIASLLNLPQGACT